MKHQTEILRHIADMNTAGTTATAHALRTRTFIRPDQLSNVMVVLQGDGLIECDDGGVWLTESGWAQYERDKPRVVSADMLVSHADGGDV